MNCTIDEIRTGLIGVRNEKYCELPETAKGYRKLYVNGELVDTFYGSMEMLTGRTRHLSEPGNYDQNGINVTGVATFQKSLYFYIA